MSNAERQTLRELRKKVLLRPYSQFVKDLMKHS
jgi:hypothetical protein